MLDGAHFESGVHLFQLSFFTLFLVVSGKRAGGMVNKSGVIVFYNILYFKELYLDLAIEKVKKYE